MSAPKTNIEKQEKRHKFPLVGMSAAVLWAGALLIGLTVWVFWNSNDPGDSVPITEDEEPLLENEAQEAIQGEEALTED